MIFPLLNDNCIYQVVNEFVKNDYESHNIGIEYGFSDKLSNEFDLDDKIYSRIGDGIYAKYKMIARVHQTMFKTSLKAEKMFKEKKNELRNV